MCWTETCFCLKVSNVLFSNFFVRKRVEESKQTVPFQENRIMIDGVKIDISSIPFRVLKIALLLFISVLLA